jgi:hypothetical protein
MKLDKNRQIFIGLALLAWLAAAGCAAGGYYGSSGPGAYRGSTSDVPPEFYNYDPTLSQWYTAPYWHPTEQ